MAELRFRPPLQEAAHSGVHGVGTPSLAITVRNGVACCLVLARRGFAEVTAERLELSLEPGRATIGAERCCLPIAPGEWLVLEQWRADGGLRMQLEGDAAGLAYVSDQSHGRQVIRVAGPAARDLLGRGCRLDLHPRKCRPGFCAATSIAEYACALVQVDAVPSFDLVVAAGYAESFWLWLTDHAAMFGYRAAIETVDRP